MRTDIVESVKKRVEQKKSNKNNNKESRSLTQHKKWEKRKPTAQKQKKKDFFVTWLLTSFTFLSRFLTSTKHTGTAHRKNTTNYTTFVVSLASK